MYQRNAATTTRKFSSTFKKYVFAYVCKNAEVGVVLGAIIVEVLGKGEEQVILEEMEECAMVGVILGNKDMVPNNRRNAEDFDLLYYFTVCGTIGYNPSHQP